MILGVLSLIMLVMKKNVLKKIGKLHRIPCYRKDGKRSLWENLTRPLRMFFIIYRICKKESYDVIHAHNMPDEGVCLFAARIAGVKHRIAHSHNTNTPGKKKAFRTMVEKINRWFVTHNATVQVGCSKQAGKDFFEVVEL